MKPLALFAFAGGMLAETALAQAPLLLRSQNPAANAPAVPYATAVTLTFSKSLDASGVAPNAVRAYGSQRNGLLAGRTSINGRVLTFVPARSLAPGERVSLSVTTAVRDSSGQALSRPYVSQFAVAATGGTGAFAGGSAPRAGASPRDLTMGDVDNDGDADALILNGSAGGGGQITTLLNSGRGTYTTGPVLSFSGLPGGLCLADVDGDRDLDLAVSLPDDDRMAVYRNNGSGTFGGGASFYMPDFPSAVVAADVDGDGDLDLLSTNTSGVGTLAVSLNNGSGTFAHRFPDVQTGGFNGGPNDLAVADVDNDGDLDVVASNGFSRTASLCLNNGTGTFARTVSTRVGSAALSPRRVLLADLNADGYLDLLTVNTAFGNGSVSVRLSSATAPFAAGYELTDDVPFDIALADVDGDGDQDLLAANNLNNGQVTVRRNAGGVFGPAVPVAVAAYPIGVATADVDGDGDLDFVTANTTFQGTASVRLNGGSGALLAAAGAALAPTLALYPNPAFGAATLAVPAAAEARAVTVFDNLGRTVRQAVLPAQATALPLDVAGLAPGVYAVRCGASAARLVVE